MEEQQEAAGLRAKADKCRRLAAGMADEETIAALLRLAAAYEQRAAEIEGAGTPPPAA
ncbi:MULTISPECIES: hypothetical protein [Sphingomonas]|uniref:hypothetical protein n=1 Tax=Sphingomonas TaxID=13687 RepID=UPI0013B3C60D|nr:MULTISPECIES: hypothetical protein [Sphingomonas]